MTGDGVIPRDLSIAYEAGKYAVKKVSVGFQREAITAIMGPSGCGKSTLLRAYNRMHELYPNIKTEGEVLLNEEDIYQMSTIGLRRKIGMVFQRPNPFPTMSIFDNVIAGYKKSTEIEGKTTSTDGQSISTKPKGSFALIGLFLT